VKTTALTPWQGWYIYFSGSCCLGGLGFVKLFTFFQEAFFSQLTPGSSPERALPDLEHLGVNLD
jgi:hypothetical protein